MPLPTGMTLQLILTSVQNRTKDTAAQYATQTTVTNYANNEVIPDIVTRTKSRKKTNRSSTISTVSGTFSYDLPSDCLFVYKAWVNDIPLQFLSMDELFRRGGGQWHTLQGYPLGYYFEDNKIALFPTPNQSSLNLIVAYAVAPAALSALSDTPDIDYRLHPAIVWGVSALLFGDRREPTLVDWADKNYEKIIAGYLNSQRMTAESSESLLEIPYDFIG